MEPPQTPSRTRNLPLPPPPPSYHDIASFDAEDDSNLSVRPSDRPGPITAHLLGPVDEPEPLR